MKWTNWGWGKVDLRWWGVQWSGVQGKRWWWQNPKSELPGLSFGEHIVGESSFLDRGDQLGVG